MEKKNRRQLVSGSVGEEHGSHQITQTSRKPNRLTNEQRFLNRGEREDHRANFSPRVERHIQGAAQRQLL